MRKYLVGALFGFIIAITMSAHADDKNTIVKEKYDIETIQHNINHENRIIWAISEAIGTSGSSDNDTDIRRYTIYEQWKVTLKKANEDLAIWEERKAALQ